MGFIKWFFLEAAMKDRGEFIINFVIYLTLIFAIIYSSLLNGYKLFYSRCKKTKEKTFKKVLVKGDFGSGKTHYVNHNEDLFKFLNLKSESASKLENYDKKLYISCTGKTSEQLLKELYFELLPKPIKCLEKVNVLDMISHVFHVRKYDVSDIKDYILKSASQKYDVIIIDDFERMCFGESVNDEIHQFTRLILEKLENYFHTVFVHSTNSRMFTNNSYNLKRRTNTSDTYRLEYSEKFDSNIEYLLEKNVWDKEHFCETQIKKCLSITEIYSAWYNFFRKVDIINYCSKYIENYNNNTLYVLDYDKDKFVSNIDECIKSINNGEDKTFLYSLFIESFYDSKSRKSNDNIFNYRTALLFARNLIYCDSEDIHEIIGNYKNFNKVYDEKKER